MARNRFRERIRVSIADQALQAALDGNARRRVEGRLNALASLPDWRARRQKAHSVRAEVITHLNEYLQTFSAKAAGNGLIVHRAADADEAVNLVLQIAGTSAAGKLVAKSKSMVSEEIELNHALEREGARVVETDLGEYIVQLRGEKPAHIITPAVHLRRHEVGQLFQEKLGIPFTDDIAVLTSVARKLLREVFLTADVGISGVNFGVAETGTLCIVTNEGNGRMVTTVPPVHIALMGMERLVPTLDDLALMLSLLPRSATAQKLTVYTQLLHSPRRPDEVDAALQRHLIIVDNGRSRIRNSQLHESLYCIRCGACLNACPVFREIGGHAYIGADGKIAPYPGPIGSVVSPGLLGLERFGHLAQASSLCGACKDACPVDIDLPRLLTDVRAGPEKPTERKEAIGLSSLSAVGLRAYGVIASSPRLFEAAQSLAGIGARIISPFAEWMRLPEATGWGLSKDFPRPAVKPFRSRFLPGDSQAQAANAPRRSSQEEEVESVAPEAPPSDLSDRFVQELELLGGSAQSVTRAALPDTLLALLRERGIDSVLAWDQVEGLDQSRLAAAGLSLVRTADASLRAGVTGAVAAIAQTGSLVLTTGKGRPLSASLLPEIHIAVVGRAHLIWSLEEALRLREVREASAAVLITGPSRTADIEMTLTIGVHGPKELIVFIVD
jgi:L-lactate dehydrogenase complex protein LldF